MKPPFSRAEYRRRVDNTRRHMREAGVDVLMVCDPANMNYLTGYDGWSFFVHQMVALGLEDAEPIWFGRPMDANGARVTTFLKQESIFEYPDHYVQSDRFHPMEVLAEIAKEKGWARARIGVEKEAYYFTVKAMEALQRHLPKATFQDATGLVNWVRLVKSKNEIAYMAQAARIAEKVMRTGINAVKPGVRQCDAAAEIWRAMIKGTPQFGGDYPGLPPVLPSGEAIAAPHLTWSDDTFKKGEGTVLELAGVRFHYHCPITRTVYLGPPPKKVTETAAIVVEGMQAAFDAMRPGVTGHDVEAAWRKVVSRFGITKESRIGYSTGLGYPPDWGEHTVSLRPNDRSVLRENATLHVIPAVTVDDLAVDISECVRVTKRGAVPFCGFPRKLFVKR